MKALSLRSVFYLIPLFVMITLLVFIDIPKEILPEKQLHTLRVATMNLNFANNKPAAVAELISDSDLDIILLLEYSKSNIDLNAVQQCGYTLAASYPMNSPYGLALLCRKGIQVKAEIHPCPVDTPCPLPFLSARLQTAVGEISILGIHPPPPISGCGNTTDDVINEFAGYLYQGRLTLSIGQAIQGDPLIIMGDLNATPFNSAVKGLQRKGLSDSYDSYNWQIGPTWKPRSYFPAIARIDYILTSDVLKLSRSFTLKIPGSDHHGVVTDISLQ